MDLSVLLKLLAVLVLVGANGFFVAAEFALVGVRRTKIRTMVEEDDRLARSVERSLENLDHAISGTQLGITLASLGLGWIGEPALARTMEGAFAGLPGVLSLLARHAVATTVAFGIITFLHIVLGELAPKSLALLHPEQVSRYVAPPLNLWNRLVLPFIWALNGSANAFLRVVGVDQAPAAHARVHSAEEIRMLVRQSFRQGVVESDEEEMIHGVFDLTHTVAREVMTPRPDIVAVPADAALEEALEMASDSGFSRLPVYGESIDEILGVVLVKDLLPWLQRDDRADLRLSEVAREALFVPETKPVDDLLAELRAEKVHMAIVVDEFGGTDGIVTLEDLLEEIVGDIYDEHDVARARIVREDDGRIQVDGSVPLTDLVEQYDLEGVNEAGYDTVAGYVIGGLGRIPERGDRVDLGDAEVEVTEVEDRRVTRVRLHLPAGAPEGSSDGSSDGSPESSSAHASTEEETS